MLKTEFLYLPVKWLFLKERYGNTHSLFKTLSNEGLNDYLKFSVQNSPSIPHSPLPHAFLTNTLYQELPVHGLGMWALCH
jgi:hypothetical protein